MGSSGMNALVKKFTKDNFPDAKSDLFACFIERGCRMAEDAGRCAMVTMHSWMFLSSFEKLRQRLLREKTIGTMAHLGARAFGSISGEVVQATAFVLRNQSPEGYRPVFFRLLDGAEPEKRASLRSGDNRFATAAQVEFAEIPGNPVAYWVSEPMKMLFSASPTLGSMGEPRRGLQPGDTPKNVRRWQEVSLINTAFEIESSDVAEVTEEIRWVAFTSGGSYRKWSGNLYFVVNWHRSGHEIKHGHNPIVPNEHLYFREAITWSKVNTGPPTFRRHPSGMIPGDASPFVVVDAARFASVFASLNAAHTPALLQVLAPTLNFQVGDVANVPVLEDSRCQINVARLIDLSESDWNAYERSWDFQSLPLLTASSEPTPTLESSYSAWITQNKDTIAEMKRLEEENNRLFIDAYGLADELTPDVPIEQITLTVNPAYRYGGKLTEEEQWTRFRQDSMEELVSYAIGCMMGRYSLDAPGLIYAHSGNEGFDPSQYTTFPADDDGIVPLNDTEWFDDDAAHRLIEFISLAWDEAHLEANLTFLADNLSPKKNESSRETLRRYLCDKFFKDHLQTYKKRPIYWLFSSGKQKAFQCLVYLHRYNEGTLSRMRSEYVIPLQGKMAARLEKLQGDIQAATSTAQSKRLEKERAKLEKQETELRAFDEKLRHYADMRIALDLDDGVKVNYGKFGDLLAEVKAVHGKKVETA